MAAVLLVLTGASRANAIYLDAERNFQLRARAYTEVAVAAERSQPQTEPTRTPFQVISHRNFLNPELEGKLHPYLSFLPVEDFSFRLALSGFYDGIYDYGTSQYDRAQRSIQGRLSFGHTNTAAVTRTDTLIDPRKTYVYQDDPVLGGYGDVPFRVNEAYFNLKKGPVFLRVGRQSISWGESDTIALLDANNPFDVTRGGPGLFEDIDETRIPLWTLRGTFDLFRSWGPISSAYADLYLVPGSIDTTVTPLPLPLASPYSPPQADPQSLLAGLIPPDVNGLLVQGAFGGIQIGLYNHLPSRSMSNSRFGLRLGGLIARDYTASVWYYRTFANPVPRFLPLDVSRAPILDPNNPKLRGPTQLITELHYGLIDVFGAAASWFSEPLDGIVRSEVEFFIGEPAFIPNKNVPFERLLRERHVRTLLGALGQNVPKGVAEGEVPHADFMRFEIGLDRFFFFRPLNPSNSFTWVSAYVGQWNMSETFGNQDYRFGGQQKATSTGRRVGANTNGLNINTIAKLHTVATDFVDLYQYESFFQSHLETSYMHGRLNPSITMIVGLNGVYALPVGLNYRFSDSLVFDLKYVLLGGNFNFPFGYFRDRSQLSARMTVLLN